MSTSNAVNCNSSGIVRYNGAGVFDAVSTTNHAVQVGSTSNGLNSLSLGTAGQVLQSGGAAADPSFSTATYPSTAGTSGNVLTSNGTNWVSSAPAGSTSVAIQVFTANGTYTPTAGMRYCIVELVGGGGGGGGIGTFTSATGAGAGGGAGGQYARSVFSAATVGASQSVTVGSGGTGGTNAPTDGNDGGTTSFGALFSAAGGAKGTGATPTSAITYPAGGVGSDASGGGSFTCGGKSGGYGVTGSTNQNVYGGAGGDSCLGQGAAQVRSVTNGTPGLSGLKYGGGGSGAAGTGNSGAGSAGGNGAGGIAIITEYF